MAPALPDPATPFGRRVREHLERDRIVWFTTVGADGTPQPNPVWFLWDGADGVLTYNLPDAHRVAHVRRRPAVSLHFNSDRAGNDVVVARGVAEIDDSAPAPDQSPEYLAKYRDDMIGISGSTEEFAAAYWLPVRVRLTRIRGY